MKRVRDFVYVGILSFVLTATAASAAMAATPLPVSAVPSGQLTSCAKSLSITTQINNSYLHSSVSSSANAANLNEVTVNIYDASSRGGMLNCQYKSASGDIPNLVYSIPCQNPTRANNGYAYAYYCH